MENQLNTPEQDQIKHIQEEEEEDGGLGRRRKRKNIYREKKLFFQEEEEKKIIKKGNLVQKVDIFIKIIKMIIFDKNNKPTNFLASFKVLPLI